MKLPGKLSEKHIVSWLVAGLALIASAALLLPQHFTLGLARYLPLHTAMETFSVVVAMLVFTVGVNVHQKKSVANPVVLSCAFLAVGLLDFGHALSYAGMPDFVTASGPEKAIYFWLAARMAAALALLAIAVLPWQREAGAWLRTVCLAAALAIVAAMYWLILFHQDILPRVFDPATGLTPFKRGLEYFIVSISAVAAFIFYRHKQTPQPYDAGLLFAAAAVAGLSELFFAAYVDVTDLTNLLGHVYKVIAYYLLYRAIFALSVRRPYRLLFKSEQSLRESEDRLRRILAGSADGFWESDLTTGAVEYSGRWAEMLGYRLDEIASQRDAWKVRIHPDDREGALKSHADYLAGRSLRYDVEFRMRAKSGEWRWIRSRGQITQRDAEGRPLRISGAHTDITEQKSAAESLALLKRQNDLILNATGEGICGVDTHGIIVFANPAAARMLGFTTDELFGQSLHGISHHTRPDGSPYPAADCPILATLHSGMTCHEGDEFYWRKDGASFPVEYTSTPIVDEGETIGAVVMFSDITRRRQVEETLQESEDLFRTLFNGITDAIFVHPVTHDGVGHFIVANNVACERLGYTHQEMLGMTPLDIDAPGTGIDIGPIVKRVAAGESVTFEQVHLAKNGRRIPVELSVNPLFLKGERAVMTLARDISGRKLAEAALRESEERYRGTFEQAAVGIAHTTLDGQFLKINPKFCDITGYSREELLRLTFRDITFPDDLARDLGHVRRALAGEVATFAMEKRYVRKDQTLVWVSLTVSLLRKADGSPHYFVGVIEDISERKRTEQQLHELTAHLQTVREEEKANIAREIHDDLGGTLTALKMETYWLARKLPAEKEMLPLLEHVESMSGLLDSAVTATRRIITELRPTILDDLGLLAALEWQCGQFQKRTGIECRFAGSEVENLELNKTRSINLFRIFQEALTNISRHSEASRVDVEFHHGDEEIALSISDNGRGLPEDRAVAPTSYGMRGMFERVEQLGGKLKFDSPPGGGLSVTVRLPVSAKKKEEQA